MQGSHQHRRKYPRIQADIGLSTDINDTDMTHSTPTPSREIFYHSPEEEIAFVVFFSLCRPFNTCIYPINYYTTVLDLHVGCGIIFVDQERLDFLFH